MTFSRFDPTADFTYPGRSRTVGTRDLSRVGSTQTHTYTTPGIYPVTVINNGGTATTIHSQIIAAGVPKDQAGKYANFLVTMSDGIQRNSKLKAALTNPQATGGAAGEIAKFADHFRALAKSHAIDLSECAQIVSKLAAGSAGSQWALIVPAISALGT